MTSQLPPNGWTYAYFGMHMFFFFFFPPRGSPRRNTHKHPKHPTALLEQQGADPNYAGSNGFSALMAAASTGAVSTVEFLLGCESINPIAAEPRRCVGAGVG